MPRISISIAAWAAATLTAVWGSSLVAAEPSESLFPNTTTGFIAVANLDGVIGEFNATQLGKLMADPVMEPFANDLRRQFDDRWSGVYKRLGLRLADLREVSGGETAMGLILKRPGEAALAIVADVTGRRDRAVARLAKISQNLVDNENMGATRTEIKVPETTAVVILYDVPARGDDPPRKIFHYLCGDLLVAAEDLEAMRDIISRAGGNRPDGLDKLPAFQTVIKRCAQDAGAKKPQIRWFVSPLGYVEALRASTPEEKRRKGKTLLEILHNQGVGAARGLGGFVDFASEGFEIVHRSYIYAPPPYEKAMKMAVLPNGRDFAPQDWVPRDVASYTTLYFDIQNAFDNFGSLFDELFGDPVFIFSTDVKFLADLQSHLLSAEFRNEFKKRRLPLPDQPGVTKKKVGDGWLIQGSVQVKVPVLVDGKTEIQVKKLEITYMARAANQKLRIYEIPTGIWVQVLESLEKDPNGPQIDLGRELISHLGSRVTAITDYIIPITTTSERMLYAFEVSDEAAVAEAIDKLMKADPTAHRRVIDGQIIWEIVEEKAPRVPRVKVGLPSLTPDEEEEEEEEEEIRLLPNAAVTVRGGTVFISSHLDFLLKVLEPRQPRESLGRSIDFRMVEASVAKLAIPKKCIQRFIRTEETYRPIYELIKQGKWPESEMLLGRILNALLGESKDGKVRKQKIDGSQMPPYGAVRRSLGPASLIVTSEPDGWFLKGFTLNKAAQ